MGNSSASVVDDDIIGMVHEAFEHPNLDSSMRNDGSIENEYGDGPNNETTNYFKLLQDAKCPLYQGCTNFTKLSFIVQLPHTKVLCGWTDKSMTILLTLLKKAFPNEVQLPYSYNDARKIMADMAFTYNTWDACPNNYGFSPFRTMGIPHSTWPVILMPYNFPPWMSMKQTFYILYVLIDGPNALGVDTYDASKNKMFKLLDALLRTISYFPAYANLSGWSTKGAKACPCCNKDTRSVWLTNRRKYCYMGHRPFLPTSHRSDVKRQLQGVLTEYKKENISKKEMT
ncbi:unnamed protein product [Prunus armeniaca]